MRAIVDRQRCFGFGRCTEEVREVFSQDEEGLSVAGDAAAVSAARHAFEQGSWSRATPGERCRLLWRLADLVEANAAELAELETLDNGKPLFAARGGDIPAAAEMFRYMSGWATKLEGATIPVGSPGSFHAYTRPEPVGVVGAIIPWNYPLVLASRKLAPALAVGCTVVLKPAEETPLTALRLGETT